VAAQGPIDAGGADITGGRLALDYTGSSNAAATRAKLQAGTIHSSNGSSSIGLGYSDTGSATVVQRAFFGDANLDNAVNGLDFNALASNFGATDQLWINADFNYDGIVNGLDFNAIAMNFGQNSPLGAVSLGSLVPEPASMGLMALAGAACIRRGRRQA